MKDWQLGILAILVFVCVLGMVCVYDAGQRSIQRELLMEGYELIRNESAKPGHGRWVVITLDRRGLE